MPGFNHYAKLRRIIDTLQPGWYIVRIDEPTCSQKFNGEVVQFDHYYRIYDAFGAQVKFGKFQQLERLAKALQIPAEALPVVTDKPIQ
ncbi:hypothetical protein EOL96_05810 [Candidatus Saccharibacteria bacterium]|nr:hypothetical protein [Candidatus Saccharibacteria bacterium]